ncbi:MAG: HNH endonuclease [Chloroflexota bacterium]|nr:HNH endonuclease [Chloroflexota bacterium]
MSWRQPKDLWEALYRHIRPTVLLRDGHKCQLGWVCDQPGETLPAEALEIDHIVPRSVDPSLIVEPSNLQAVCRPCHHRKTMLEQGYSTSGRRKRVRTTPRATPMELTS